ncbi:hypothetical protein FNL55_12760 [Tardiphaga sp. vice352]|uniref:hypothetical protein n=1 Tax=Tardiphaga sp. vice352 TaxID=2592816 RepID=UPI0011629635|nr:hypothetical protein [Tardiphaga sp. vice352]QDM32110.1 hypothetical protein FNL55_12760 [Tardiphaga sp. vice352]
MTWLAFIAALAKALPVVLDLVSRFKASADAAAARGQGYDEAVADGLKLMTQQLAEIDVSVEEARQKQAATPGDAGRDTQFRRD